EIEVFFHNIFSKRKKYAYYLEYNKRVDKEIIILDNILMYSNTNNKELLNEITYYDLNNIALNKIREYNTNPILKNLSLGFKMKFYKNEVTDEKLEENINSKIQNSLNEDAVLRLLDRITKDKLDYENNQLEKSYENKFD
ncbi:MULTISPECIES: hypothetical protein, partial [Bacteria]|uniref:hypothetical protein n=1 Tax=Bacteria TaxID=2 RepID=UPI003F39E067